NFSAKPPAQLFASDCTGAGCHKGPQGLARGGILGMTGLAGFLREHYTNSRESASALANYLARLPGAPEKEGRGAKPGKPVTAAAPAAPAPASGPASWFESVTTERPAPGRARETPANQRGTNTA